MSQTNYNRFIRIVFDREINATNLESNYKAFILYGKQRPYYGGPLEDVSFKPESIEYAVDSSGNINKRAIILKFPNTNDNFRKTEGELTLSYDSNIGNLYGATDLDVLPSTDFKFTAVNTDMFQNPITYESILFSLVNNTSNRYILLNKLESSTYTESINVKLSSKATYEILLVGAINP